MNNTEYWLVTCRIRAIDGMPDEKGLLEIPDCHPNTGKPYASDVEVISVVQRAYLAARLFYRYPQHAFTDWIAEKTTPSPEASEGTDWVWRSTVWTASAQSEDLPR